jgi:GntR family transcriptional regulator, transcriptional repressor for pyruvate dehydrogenase complex
MAAPLTDQAIAKIKDLIISGEFKAGSKLPREQDLAAKLGLSRNSLREAVRALALIGVLDTRVGDGTYVTSLDADLLLTGMGFVGDLLDGTTLLEVHQVRRNQSRRVSPPPGSARTISWPSKPA